jgi:adenine-specific DNA-methyltransferase
MDLDQIPLAWSKRFGLAISPLFELQEVPDPTSHHVFLDGGQGTFALSVAKEEIWRDSQNAAWAWSSDIAHHVTVTPSKVAVVRWDDPTDPTVLTRTSVDKSLDEFYKFIAADRVKSTRTVVYHLLSLFRQIRSLGAGANIPDSRASELFLFSLSRLIFEDKLDSISPSVSGVGDDVPDLFDRLDKRGIETALAEVGRSTAASSVLQLHPALAIRHAGGLLFQEAHFEFLRAPSVDFFGHIGAPELNEIGRGGAHFTPPALARILVEQALEQIPNIAGRPKLTVCDPACGSGVFLHEVLRALRRCGFSGELVLIGQDISPVAISMAKFVLNCAIRDWSPAGGIRLELGSIDSLEDKAMPKSDLIVMNPPFISWGSQSEKQRAQLIAIAGRAASSRGDLSMAFVIRALEALAPDGVLGAIFPASLLSQRSAEKWRERIADDFQIKFLASIGDYGLFTHALVQVACGVFKNGDGQQTEITGLVAANDPRATGDALRTIRKMGSLPPSIPVAEDQWSIFALSSKDLKQRNTWRLRAPEVDAALRKLEDALPSLSDLFDVRQGVQTGHNPALLLSRQEWLALPKRERAFFRSATMTDSIKNGQIIKPYFLFFPHTAKGPLFLSEKELKSAVPDYYQKYLSPNKSRLASRASIRRSGRSDWWGLMEPRSWSFLKAPRIISKYFSGEGGFYADLGAEYLPSTGFAWLPKPPLNSTNDPAFPIEKLLIVYAALFNSATFGRLLQYYAPHVSGGQFDLSPRYVNDVPLPDFAGLVSDPVRGRSIRRLADLAEAKETNVSRLGADETESIFVGIYGPKIVAAL